MLLAERATIASSEAASAPSARARVLARISCLPLLELFEILLVFLDVFLSLSGGGFLAGTILVAGLVAVETARGRVRSQISFREPLLVIELELALIIRLLEKAAVIVRRFSTLRCVEEARDLVVTGDGGARSIVETACHLGSRQVSVLDDRAHIKDVLVE